MRLPDQAADNTNEKQADQADDQSLWEAQFTGIKKEREWKKQTQ
jgi:hypothetical protein